MALIIAQERKFLSEQHPPKPGAWHKRRSRKSKSRRPFGLRFLTAYGPDVLLLLLLGVVVLLLLNPLWVTAVAPSSRSPLITWLLNENSLSVVVAVLLLGFILLASLRLRWRINHWQKLWGKSCPQCGSEHLSRIHRTLPDRLLGRVGIPVRRYMCRQCRWQGVRIDEMRI